MASERERVLLGYLPTRNSDVNYGDVFGGPPRRGSSVGELRRGVADSLDLGSWRASGSDSGSGSGLGERPVFGEISSPARRRHLKDGFFSDIFQSGESAGSSPRRGERDLASSPGSRVLGPTRPLPPVRGEAVGGGASLPAQLSLSMKLAKGTKHLMSSPTQRAPYISESGTPDSVPSSPIPSFATRAAMTQDELKIDGNVLYRQSPQSRQVSHSFDNSSEVSNSTGAQTQEETTTLESYVSKGQFHFSIYKWAGKGVTLIMHSKPNSLHESRFKRLPEIVVQEVDVILHEADVPTLNNAYKNQGEGLNKSMKDTIMKTKDADSTAVKDMHDEFESKFFHIDETKISDTYSSINDKDVPVAGNYAQNNDLKNLWQLFDDDLDKETKDMISQVQGTEHMSRREQSIHANINIKHQAASENEKYPVKVSSLDTVDTVVSPEEKPRGNRVKGKVKDFIKIFNQGGSPKRKGTFETPSRRPGGKDDGKGKAQDQVAVSAAKTEEQVPATTNINSTLSDAPVPVVQNSGISDKVNININFDVHMIDDYLSDRNDPLRPDSGCVLIAVLPDSTPDILDASVENIEESHFEDLEGCLVEPLSQDQNIQSDSIQDQFKSIDAKIRAWSKGKEGNIRSLLSTLQFVLWPDSGWKPVPLVDIIEGSAVKRAYQKALLRLHPDKLQQKGVAADRKYIAEKVFDIMQEAWGHFNSSSQVF